MPALAHTLQPIGVMNLPKLASMVVTGIALVSFSGSALADAKPLEVKRLVFARGIDGHEPQEVGTTFSTKDDRVYAFVELSNAGADDNIDVVFQPPSGGSFAVPLKVSGKAARFRTWAFTRKTQEAGEWTVIVRDSGNKVLSRQSFTVTK
ncbi:MAG: hypothetical protein JWP87_6412 [Labilithrix sp.]|nr:hypothetical protein [Labilithrix sp.]